MAQSPPYRNTVALVALVVGCIGAAAVIVATIFFALDTFGGRGSYQSVYVGTYLLAAPFVLVAIILGHIGLVRAHLDPHSRHRAVIALVLGYGALVATVASAITYIAITLPLR